ncbi:SpoIIAA-like [Nitrosomonas marina]|uniref:SpoIIAA-like n=1 Tax=Nitrosomonas marina TaxID=917 RepID=A0A1H9YBN2_9PROT|nr:STAS/SEC14 domain-containing protein [Nitrosomonas marina]SES66365.1 SpoIIAA-like [Nitrosomonas marina]
MITIQKQNSLIIVAVIGEFTLSDYKSFEEQIIYQSTFEGKANVVIDLRDMIDYTVDVAWEDLKFMHEHGNDFNHIAVVTDDQWQAWSAWISNLFTDAEVVVFQDYDKAIDWVTREDSSSTAD